MEEEVASNILSCAGQILRANGDIQATVAVVIHPRQIETEDTVKITYSPEFIGSRGPLSPLGPKDQFIPAGALATKRSSR